MPRKDMSPADKRRQATSQDRSSTRDSLRSQRDQANTESRQNRRR